MLPSRWIPALLLALTFALGLSLGYIVRSELFQDSFRDDLPMRGPGGRGGPGPGGDMIPPFVMEQLGDELELTPEQRNELRRILDIHRMRMEDLRERVIQPETRVIMDSTRAAMSRTLTPEQAERFRTFRQRFRRENFRPRGGPPDQSPIFGQ